jgi:hypothetical protein
VAVAMVLMLSCIPIDFHARNMLLQDYEGPLHTK